MRGMHQAAILFVMAAGWSAAFCQAKSGLYGNLAVGVNGTTVTGVFSDARPGNGTEDAPQFSCLFLLRGTLNGSAAKVAVWSPFGGTVEAELGGSYSRAQQTNTATINGTLTFEKDTVKLRLEGDPPGCAATGDEFASTVYEEPSVMEGKWTAVRLVSAGTADMLEAPVNGSSRKTRLNKGEVVVIYRQIGPWLECEDPNSDRPLRGWLRRSDLAPDQP